MRVCRYYNTPPIVFGLNFGRWNALHRTRETIGVYDRSAPRETVNQKSLTVWPASVGNDNVYKFKKIYFTLHYDKSTEHVKNVVSNVRCFNIRTHYIIACFTRTVIWYIWFEKEMGSFDEEADTKIFVLGHFLKSNIFKKSILI